jgi:ATP-binding cassette subfamily F protein 3
LRKEIVAVEQKMHKFQDLLRRIDQALASSGPTAGATPQVVGLAAKRTELERALLQTEEEWLELSARAEAMN